MYKMMPIHIILLLLKVLKVQQNSIKLPSTTEIIVNSTVLPVALINNGIIFLK